MRIICYLSLLLFSSILLAKQGDKISVEALYAVDSNSVWNKSSVPKYKFKHFNKNRFLNINYNTDASVWCLFKIKNNSPDKSVNKWICFNNTRLDSIIFYEGENIKLLGDRTYNTGTFIQTLGFEINLKPNEKRDFLFRVKKNISNLDFTYSIKNFKSLNNASKNRILLIAFLLGFISLLVIFSAALFYITKKKIYLFYILYAVITTSYLIVTTNTAKFLFFPKFIYFTELRIYFETFWFVALSLLLTNFLNLKKLQPIKYFGINILNSTNLIIILFSIYFLTKDNLEPIYFLIKLGYINFILIIILLIWSLINHIKVQQRESFLVMIVFSPHIFWGLGIVLKSFNLIERNISDNVLITICMYELFVFGFILNKIFLETFEKNTQLIDAIIREKEKSISTITQVQISERRNIANIIHDNMGSKIAYILQLIQLNDMPSVKKCIKELSKEIRDISHQILPKALDEGALISSLESQIESMNSGLVNSKIYFFNYDFPDRIKEKWIYDIYLISMEIIQNAFKHGNAKMISIEFYCYENHYHFQFIDDGKGFNIKKIPKGFGLENIERRVINYKGTFEINSIENEGTIIQINIPKKLNFEI